MVDQSHQPTEANSVQSTTVGKSVEEKTLSKKAERKKNLKIFVVTTIVGTISLTFAFKQAGLPQYVENKVAEAQQKHEKQEQARDQVLQNLDMYSAQVNGMISDKPGSDSKVVGLVAPTEPPRLPDLTQEQKEALDPIEIAAYERMQSRAYNFMPKMEIPSELLEPITLSCAASDFMVDQGTTSVGMAVDEYDPNSDAPLAPAKNLGNDVFSAAVAQRANDPGKAFERSSNLVHGRIDSTTKAISQISNGLAAQQLPEHVQKQMVEKASKAKE